MFELSTISLLDSTINLLSAPPNLYPRTMPPSSAEALVVKTNGSAASTLERRFIPVPSPCEHQVLVRISHVAQNPTDGTVPPDLSTRPRPSLTPPVQSLDTKAFDDGAVLGCDFVETIEQLGPASPAS
jgi:NADPH:quinone reductase-like Zn-dependent oxidoreductase